MILTSECCAFGEGAIAPYFKRFGFDAADTQTHDLPDAKQEHYHQTTATKTFILSLVVLALVDLFQ
jgi:hypothetical protein